MAIKQKIKTKKLSAPESRFGVILESIDSKFKQVLEGHSTLDKKIDKLSDRTDEGFKLFKTGLDGLTGRVDGLTGRVDGLTGRVDGLTSKVNGLTSKADGLTSKADGLIHDVNDLKNSSKQILEYLKRIDNEIQGLKKVLSRKADLERLVRLEQRVAAVELVVKKFYGKNSN